MLEDSQYQLPIHSFLVRQGLYCSYFVTSPKRKVEVSDILLGTYFEAKLIPAQVLMSLFVQFWSMMTILLPLFGTATTNMIMKCQRN